MFAGKSGDIGENFRAVGDLVRNEPGALAVFKMDLDAPENVDRPIEPMDLLDHASEIGPGKAIAVIPGDSVFGEDFHGAGMAAAREPENGPEERDGN